MATLQFLTDETGAVTIDMVVLTAGIVGLGLAVTAAVSPGVTTGSNNIANMLNGILASVVHSGQYETGDDHGWVGATLHDFGSTEGAQVLIPDGNGSESVSQTFDLPDGATTATVSFDLLGVGSIDYEPVDLYIDGNRVGSVNKSILLYENQEMANGSHVGHSWFDESKATMTFSVDTANPTMTVGFGSQTNEAVENEAWAFNNVSVIAE